MTKSNNTWDKQRGNRKNITKSKDTIDKNNNKWDKHINKSGTKECTKEY